MLSRALTWAAPGAAAPKWQQALPANERKGQRLSPPHEVFDLWKSMEKSRINEANYEKIIEILVKEGLVEEAEICLREMKCYGLQPSIGIYNSVIHGFARKGSFDNAMFYLREMEDVGEKPDSETYDGLIQAYGNYKMYDEIDQCVRVMESKGYLCDHITYNLLVREFARAGLLQKMESMYNSLYSRRIGLQASTLVAMLEAYAKFGILDKMEKMYRRILNSKSSLKEDVIRKLAAVYIDNRMFSRLEGLGVDLSAKTGCTDLVWCLRILSRACVLSKKEIYSIIQEMESHEVPWNATTANIISLAYLKMNDFKDLKVLLSELPSRYVKPDLVTVGVLFDACVLGFDGASVKSTWRKMGFLDDDVDMNTDSLVLSAFGKGQFLRSCEQMYRSLNVRSRAKEAWTYGRLIGLVIELNRDQVGS
ncbi:pentatricopeptide repeat-containing protein At4g14190, chloroplastic-like [Olea europaea var. sylvestris]|uniref:pentatricopeptide repeat-containing protein At4g14190, chloroplastic-like n=1 Tax=Olea europaea var. sylvestris TaxID=158386 RepID=UPI000C1D095F|nr:pentatricopeptide repeat-containing protein At4g14190, chloroplastic-like [Olea europaea var. sylvestris]